MTMIVVVMKRRRIRRKRAKIIMKGRKARALTLIARLARQSARKMVVAGAARRIARRFALTRTVANIMTMIKVVMKRRRIIRRKRAKIMGRKARALTLIARLARRSARRMV